MENENTPINEAAVQENVAGATLPDAGCEHGIKVCSKRRKRRCLWLLCGAAFSSGLLTGVLEEGSLIATFYEYAVQLFSLVMVLAWCYLDAEEREFKITPRLSIALVFILILAFPYYLTRTRNQWQTLWSLGLAALFCIVYVIALIAGEWLGCIVYNVINGYGLFG